MSFVRSIPHVCPALPAAISVTILLSGCAAAGGGDVINLGGGSGELCASVESGAVFVVGEVVSLARGDTPVTISEVSLVQAAGIELVDAYSVPFDAEGTGIMSMGLDHPPEVWALRVPAEGAPIVKEPTGILGYGAVCEVSGALHAMPSKVNTFVNDLLRAHAP